MRYPQVIESISNAVKEFAPDAKAILFGSEARREARSDSDIDLLILLPDNTWAKRYVEGRDELSGRLYEIELANDVMISPVILLRSMWDSRKTQFTVNINNEGIEI